MDRPPDGRPWGVRWIKGKDRFGWRKVRFRGLVKNAEYAYAAAACVNIYHHRRRLLEYLGKSLGRAGAAFCFG
jgi:IS5 family transposase